MVVRTTEAAFAVHLSHSPSDDAAARVCLDMLTTLPGVRIPTADNGCPPQLAFSGKQTGVVTGRNGIAPIPAPQCLSRGAVTRWRRIWRLGSRSSRSRGILHSVLES